MEKRGKSIRSAAKLLGIKYSTAKTVLKNYHTTGHVETLLTRKRKAMYASLSREARAAEDTRANGAPSNERHNARELQRSVESSQASPAQATQVDAGSPYYCSCCEHFSEQQNPPLPEKDILNGYQQAIVFL